MTLNVNGQPPSSGGTDSSSATVYAFDDDTGWTIEAGAIGTAGIVDGVARLTLPASTVARWHGATGNQTAPRIWRALPSMECSVRMRLSSVSGGNALTRACLYLHDEGTPDTRLAQVMIAPTDEIYGQNISAGNVTMSAAPSVTADSTAWIRVDVRADDVSFWGANGSGGAEPDDGAWAYAGSGSGGGSATVFTRFGIALSQYDTGASGPELEVDSITVRPL